MLSSFWESIGEGLSEKWLERLFGPAFLFWTGGLLLWIGPQNLAARWEALAALPAVTQAALLIGALLVLAASERLGSAFCLPVLRFLEGYWPWPLRRPAAWIAARRRARVQRSRYRWNELMQKREQAPLPWPEARELARLEAERRYTPRDLEDVMPTRFGDVLRAAETRPRQRYGLDPVLLWPHLWQGLPEAVRADLAAARAALDRLAEAWLWGLLFALWSFAWPWAWVIALVWLAVAYELLVQAARPFADLILAAFDTHRWALYQSLRWPLPESSDVEKAAGEALTRFVQRDMLDAPVKYA